MGFVGRRRGGAYDFGGRIAGSGDAISAEFSS
jgi:hypothetical protein